MTTISSAGIGSGLDVNSIVNSLMAIERQPLTRLQSAATTLQTRLSSFGQVQSLVSGLHDAAAPLFAAGSFTLTSASSSDPTGVNAGTSGAAVPGTYSVVVSALAATQVAASQQFTDSSSAVGTGSLTLTLGGWAGTTFTAKTGAAPVTIAIGAADNTLQKIRDKINAAGAGVTAALVTDSGGTRLSLTSNTTGASNGFKITAADDDGNNTNNAGLSRLRYDPSVGTNGALTASQAAADAAATVNGIAVSSSGNTLSSVVDGVTFTLGKVTVNANGNNPVSINVTRNTDSIKSQLKNFVASYNTLHSFLAQQTKYDSATKTAALLQGDSTAVSIENQMSSMLTSPSTASSVFSSFSALGVQLQKDGSLTLNDAVATTALTNLPEVTKALSAVGTTAGNKGLAQRVSKWTDDLLASNGTLPGKTKSIQSSIASNQKNQDAFNDRLTLIEQRIRAQYTALDTTMSKANALAKYVTQQFSNNNNNSSR